MATKGNSKGRYVTKIGFYDIYAKDSYRPKKDGAKKQAKPEVSGTEFNIYHSKKLVQKGLKLKEQAIVCGEYCKAQDLMREIITELA